MRRLRLFVLLTCYQFHSQGSITRLHNMLLECRRGMLFCPRRSTKCIDRSLQLRRVRFRLNQSPMQMGYVRLHELSRRW